MAAIFKVLDCTLVLFWGRASVSPLMEPLGVCLRGEQGWGSPSQAWRVDQEQALGSVQEGDQREEADLSQESP